MCSERLCKRILCGLLVSSVALCSMASRAEEGDAMVSESYLTRVQRALDLCRADIPAMAPVAEEAAKRLVAGGKFWAGGQPSMVSELCGRAGGFMMLKGLSDASVLAPGDVVLYVPEPGIAFPEPLANSEAYVVLIGGCDERRAWPCFPNHAAEAGISPTLANAIPGWVFTGELVAALTRLDKMPVMYESIGGYGGNARIQQYQNGAIAWHEKHEVSPVAAGVLGNRFLDAESKILGRIESKEHGALNQAGAWAAGAHAAGKTLYMFSMGHLFPDEVGKTEIGKLFHSDVWNAGFRHPLPEVAFAAGDMVVHIGYQHPPERLLEQARGAGAKVVYVSVYSARDYVRDPEVVWVDCMWPWADAVVPLAGYDIPILAASGIVNGAVAWEIYRLAAAGAPAS